MVKNSQLSSIESNEEYFEKSFVSLDMNKSTIIKTIFEECNFIDCHFSEATFNHCKFVDCAFKSSDLSLAKLNDSTFVDIEFNACKMTGVNWTSANWPNFTLACPVFFNACDLSLSNFYELKLPEISMIDCKAHDVDFRECDMTSADFSNTDLEKSQFIHTNLSKANFIGAISYFISPVENCISKAKFSLPEAINLLQCFNIEVD